MLNESISFKLVRLEMHFKTHGSLHGLSVMRPTPTHSFSPKLTHESHVQVILVSQGWGHRRGLREPRGLSPNADSPTIFSC